ncbi:hypothetical protein N0V82_006235 [Gnomoniopsis sp. IMI 355080]|nr:hypothetical protein N0V82_006235 [Gnomoniopsis sp. IMI 355080]
MADPLLTTLCAICHAQPPKYTCPACATHTCSLPCTQRHKAWSSCTGRRDPTAFIPVSKLKTPAGVDHDYNFLSAIERARERTQRDLLGESGDRPAPLFTPAQLGRDLDGERRWRREWFGEEVRFVSKAGGGRSGSSLNPTMGSDGEEEGGERAGAGSSLARKVRYRLDALGTEVVRMPVGMTRQRENTTAWNRRAGRINWCVEWFVYECPAWPSSEGEIYENTMTVNHQEQPLRIRHKALETRSLYRALGDSLAWYHRGLTKPHDFDSDDDDTTTTPARKRRRLLIKELKDDLRRTTPQDHITTAFSHPTPYPTQNPYTGAWEPAHDRAAAVRSWLGDEVVERMRREGWRFYLLRAPTPAGRDRELIPCQAEESLEQMLRGRTVVEFPTVYVLPPSFDGEDGKLPPGFVLGSTERRAPLPLGKRRRQQQQQQQPKKRKAALKGHDAMRTHDNKRQRGGGAARGGRGRGGRVMTMAHREREEGEVVSGEEAAAAADTTSSDPDTSSDEDVDMDDRTVTHGAADSSTPAGKDRLAPSSSSSPPHTTRLGALVGYGSDSSDEDVDEDDEEGEEVTNADLASLKPENPELVASAIQEIVGLLT